MSSIKSVIITQKSPSELFEWLAALIKRLGDAAPRNSNDSVLARLESLRQTAHQVGLVKGMQDGDPARPAQVVTLRRLVRTLTMRVITEVFDGLQTTPVTEEALEQRVNEIIQGKLWRIACANCGGHSRDTKVFDMAWRGHDESHHVCKNCRETNAVKCSVCSATVMLNFEASRINTSDHASSATVCAKCYGEHAFECAGCRSDYHGTRYHPKGELFGPEAANINMCRRCSSAACKCEHCKKPTVRPVEFSVGVDHIEDGDLVLRKAKKVKACADCRDQYQVNRPETWNAGRVIMERNPSRYLKSDRYYGVEVEVCYAPNAAQCPPGIRNHWHAKHDQSLPRDYGIEFASIPLQGDNGLDVVRELCDFGEKMNWAVNKQAGLHIHAGVDNLTDEQKASVALGYLFTHKIWMSLVAPERVNHRFCCKHDLERNNRVRAELATLVESAPKDMLKILCPGRGEAADRYRWVNWNAMHKHGTVEIRLHQGTIDYHRIANWITAHLRFIDWCAAQGTRVAINQAFSQDKISGSCRNMFLFMTQSIWKDRALGRWFRNRAVKFQHGTHNGPYIPMSCRKLRKAGINPLEEV